MTSLDVATLSHAMFLTLCLPQLCDGVSGARSATAPFSKPHPVSCMGGKRWQNRRSAYPCSSSIRHSSGALFMVGWDRCVGFGQAMSTMVAGEFAAKNVGCTLDAHWTRIGRALDAHWTRHWTPRKHEVLSNINEIKGFELIRVDKKAIGF